MQEKKEEPTLFNTQYNGRQTKIITCDLFQGKIYCGATWQRPRLYILPTLQRGVFKQFQNLSQLIKTTIVKLITDGFVWFNITAGIREWMKYACGAKCIKFIDADQVYEFLPACFTKMYSHLVGSLPLSKSCIGLLTIVNWFITWL